MVRVSGSFIWGLSAVVGWSQPSAGPARGWLWKHESGTFVKLTPAGVCTRDAGWNDCSLCDLGMGRNDAGLVDDGERTRQAEVSVADGHNAMHGRSRRQHCHARNPVF